MTNAPSTKAKVVLCGVEFGVITQVTLRLELLGLRVNGRVGGDGSAMDGRSAATDDGMNVTERTHPMLGRMIVPLGMKYPL
jgi:hypothetical protein